MAILDVRCPGRTGLNVIKPGQLSHGAQRYRGSAMDCDRNRFIPNYRVMGRTVEAKVKIVVLVMDESGIRNTIRAVNLSPTTVIRYRTQFRWPFYKQVAYCILSFVYHERHPATIWHRPESTQSSISHGPEGNPARHLNRLTTLVSGIVSRWLNNERIDLEIYFPSLPPTLLESLAHRPHFLVMDGSVIGRGGSTLTINVICRKRALLLAWIVLE